MASVASVPVNPGSISPCAYTFGAMAAAASSGLVVGLTGLNCAGKGAVADVLVKHGFVFFSCRCAACGFQPSPRLHRPSPPHPPPATPPPGGDATPWVMVNRIWYLCPAVVVRMRFASACRQTLATARVYCNLYACTV